MPVAIPAIFPSSSPPSSSRILLIGFENAEERAILDGWLSTRLAENSNARGSAVERLPVEGSPVEGVAEIAAFDISALDAAAAGSLLDQRLSRRPPKDPPCVVVFGPRTSSSVAAELISKYGPTEAQPFCRFLVLAAGHHADVFEPLIERDLVFYLSADTPEPKDVVALLAAALDQDPRLSSGLSNRTENPSTTAEPPHEVVKSLEKIERESSLDDVLEALEQAAAAWVPCRRAQCRCVDTDTLTLWRPDDQDGEGRDSSIVGLIGYVARTGMPVHAPRIGDDQRYDADSDNGRRSDQERFFAVALPAESSHGGAPRTEAVLTVARGARQEPFSAAERDLLEHLAKETGPILRRRRLSAERAAEQKRTQVFRGQALAYQEQGLQTRAEPLRVAPLWLGQAYRSVLILAAIALLGLPFIGNDEFAVGRAVVRLEARQEIRSPQAGVLGSLSVRPGDSVRSGQELGRLESSQEEAELAQLQQELELRLVERLRHPQRPAAGSSSAFVALREQQRVAAARLERLRLRAPRDGMVGDLLVRPGRPVAAGQSILAIVADTGAKTGVEAEERSSESSPSIDVLLPGQYLPLLQVGMDLRFKIDGYADVEQILVIQQISRQVISSQQAHELVEPAVAGAATGPDTLVIVQADLLDSSFTSDGRQFPFYDGMTGSAEIRVRKKRFISDWLRKLWQRRPRA